jgi:hypothetical protein
LVQQSDNKNKGINKLSILTVSASFSWSMSRYIFESLHAVYNRFQDYLILNAL